MSVAYQSAAKMLLACVLMMLGRMGYAARP